MSILIGKHIKSALESNRNIKMAVGNRIYPVVVTQSSPAYPLIVYQSIGTRPDESTKDGNCEDTVTVDIVLLIADYSTGIDLLQDIRYTLEGITADYPQFSVTESELVGTSEQYDDDIAKYAFGISFNFKTIDK